jgi:hypothetical protein
MSYELEKKLYGSSNDPIEVLLLKFHGRTKKNHETSEDSRCPGQIRTEELPSTGLDLCCYAIPLDL